MSDPLLLAAVAIVHCTGPEMLRMLQRHTFGPTRDKFIQATDHMVPLGSEWGTAKTDVVDLKNENSESHH